MLLSLSGNTLEDFNNLFDTFDERVRKIAASSPNGYIAIIKGTRHFNYSDFPCMANLSALANLIVGDLEPTRNAELINALTKAFFDEFLLSKKDAFPIDASNYEELTLTEVTSE